MLARLRSPVGFAFSFVVAVLSQSASICAHGTTERISVGTGGVQSNADGFDPAVSTDGRFVAFWSAATNLVRHDTNGAYDVFVRDLKADTTDRASLGPGGIQGNGSSDSARLSADGRFVAFASGATNLVAGDTNENLDVFVRDRQMGTTRRVSVGPGGAQGDGTSSAPTISANGRFVAFTSSATNLVAGDTNGLLDVFVRDLKANTTERVSLGPGGAETSLGGGNADPAISANGRFVAFLSTNSDLVPNDTNEQSDIFVHDLRAGTTERVSVGRGGVQGNGPCEALAISADGRFVAFSSLASNLILRDTNDAEDVFVRDRQKGITRRVSVGPGGVQGNAGAGGPAISSDGRFVAFASFSSNLVIGDTNRRYDTFVRDRQWGTTRRVSVGAGGIQGNGNSLRLSISANGRVVAFESDASNLVPGDRGGFEDVFIRTLAP